MKHSSKKFIVNMSIALSVAFMSCTQALAAERPEQVEIHQAPLQVVVDGAIYAPPAEQSGILYQNSTYVPLRFAAYALGLGVEWDGDSYTVNVANPDAAAAKAVEEYRGKTKKPDNALSRVGTSDVKPKRISVYFKPVTYIFNGIQAAPSENQPAFRYSNGLV